MSKRKKRSRRNSGAFGHGIIQGIGQFLGWIIAVAAVAGIATIVVAVIALSGSSSDGTAVPPATQKPDPRVGGATPATSTSITANDGGQEVNPRFEPQTIEGRAGNVTEIVIKNAGSVAHNLRVAGVDKQYDTADDFASLTVQPGNEQRLLVKIDAPGSYEFRCDFHPDQQTGTLVLK